MSDEVSRRLTDAAGAHARAVDAGADVSLVAASVIGKARRRRRVTASLTVAGAVAGVIAFGGGTFAVMNTLRAGETSLAMAAEVPTWGPSSVAVSTPQPTTSAEPSPIAIADYPPLAPSRGAGFPVAYEMRDWVWDYVGAGWSLRSYSASAGVYSGTSPAASGAVLYLVGPHGETFELPGVGSRVLAGTASGVLARGGANGAHRLGRRS